MVDLTPLLDAKGTGSRSWLISAVSTMRAKPSLSYTRDVVACLDVFSLRQQIV